MPVESAEDLAIFFDTEEYGVSALYAGPDEEPRSIAVLYDPPAGESQYGKVSVTPGVHVVRIQRADVARPVAGAIVRIDDVGELILIGQPYSDRRSRAMWVCYADLVAG